MQNILLFAVLGLGEGALIAALAMSVVVFSVISGATRMPNAPAMMLASSELTSDRRRGDTPAYIAYRSLSAAALVDRPN